MPRAARTLALALTLAGGSTAGARRLVVHSGESIQAAIDAAPAGATIRVEPGTYHEAGATRAVTVTKAGIRLVGAARPGRPVVLTDDQNTFLDVGGAGGSRSATMSRLSLGDDDCPSGETCVVTGGSYRLHYTI